METEEKPIRSKNFRVYVSYSTFSFSLFRVYDKTSEDLSFTKMELGDKVVWSLCTMSTAACFVYTFVRLCFRLMFSREVDRPHVM